MRADQPRIPFTSIPCTSIPFTSIPFTSIPFTSIPLTSNRHVAAGAHHGRAAGRQPLRVECARILIGPTGTGGVKVAASSRNGGKRQRRLTLRLTLRRRTDRQQRPATTTARSTCFCPGCCRMTSTNWSISERTVRTGFRALQGTREAKSSGVLLPSMHPRCVSEGVSVSAIECRLVQPAAGESVGVAPHRRCTVRNGAGLRPALNVKVWAAQPAPRASVRCPLPPSVVWTHMATIVNNFLDSENLSSARGTVNNPD